MGIRILVVDDEPNHRMLVRAIVEDVDGLTVVGEAHHGRRGVELAAELQPEVVVLDLRMPTMDGLTALPLLRRVAPRARVIVWSNDGELQLLRAMEAGAAACVRKFDTAENLLYAIRDRRTRDSDDIATKELTMPRSWSDRRERQYEHIRDGYIDSGTSRDEAEERAARTVNARRSASGEARDSSNAPTKSELYAQAKRFDITGRSKMDKEQLENAIAGHRGGEARSRS